MIGFESIRHRYGDREVLRGVDLTLTEPRVGVIGANGSGKSTLARMVNGLVTPDVGARLVERARRRPGGRRRYAVRSASSSRTRTRRS